jgi:hypothetical protein
MTLPHAPRRRSPKSLLPPPHPAMAPPPTPATAPPRPSASTAGHFLLVPLSLHCTLNQAAPCRHRPMAVTPPPPPVTTPPHYLHFQPALHLHLTLSHPIWLRLPTPSPPPPPNPRPSIHCHHIVPASNISPAPHSRRFKDIDSEDTSRMRKMV